MIQQLCKSVSEMQTVRRDQIHQRMMQVTAMQGVVRCAESGLNLFP
jgi:hypothetical protein